MNSVGIEQFCLVCKKECPDPVTFLDWYIFLCQPNDCGDLPVTCSECASESLNKKSQFLKIRVWANNLDWQDKIRRLLAGKPANDKPI